MLHSHRKPSRAAAVWLISEAPSPSTGPGTQWTSECRGYTGQGIPLKSSEWPVPLVFPAVELTGPRGGKALTPCCRTSLRRSLAGRILSYVNLCETIKARCLPGHQVHSVHLHVIAADGDQWLRCAAESALALLPLGLVGTLRPSFFTV